MTCSKTERGINVTVVTERGPKIRPYMQSSFCCIVDGLMTAYKA